MKKKIFLANLHSKHFLMFAITILFLTTSCQDSADPNHTMTNPGRTTVEQAKKLKDDAWVTIAGTIERYLGDEKYLFADHTGSIIIEIDYEVWLHNATNPATVIPELPAKFEIVGEVDKDKSKVEIDVKIVRRL